MAIKGLLRVQQRPNLSSSPSVHSNSAKRSAAWSCRWRGEGSRRVWSARWRASPMPAFQDHLHKFHYSWEQVAEAVRPIAFCAIRMLKSKHASLGFDCCTYAPLLSVRINMIVSVDMEAVPRANAISGAAQPRGDQQGHQPQPGRGSHRASGDVQLQRKGGGTCLPRLNVDLARLV